MACSHYLRISNRSQRASVTFKAKNKETIPHLAIGFTGFKLYGESEW
ncbi:hypothetical protein BTN50_0156 [Candidatus Enterovibrio altilux]|uniref:Mobile element protein n=1 Tax=Candidatus Enterovibrio altilux TaxID=1927128 RepID=A0A291B6T1_9GAMM|nr:hypothetical protein BTN50_0156 [Candidatus Enterovibrio luxaltus]